MLCSCLYIFDLLGASQPRNQESHQEQEPYKPCSSVFLGLTGCPSINPFLVPVHAVVMYPFSLSPSINSSKISSLIPSFTVAVTGASSPHFRDFLIASNLTGGLPDLIMDSIVDAIVDRLRVLILLADGSSSNRSSCCLVSSC